ncbi:hypothetical protein AAG906_007532 [Vitis piasezkii]
MQGEKQGEEENRVKESRGQQLQSSFPLLSTFEVHFLHSIYHFESQEVKNPMLQTVCDSELKRRSYGPTRYMPQAGTLRTSRWKPISQPCEDSLVLKLFRSPLECLRNLRHHFLLRNVNLNAFKSPGPTLGKASDLRPWRFTSLPLRAFGRWFEGMSHCKMHRERDLVFEPINGKHLYNTGWRRNYIETPSGHESNGAVAGDVVHAILNTIAEEAMNFMSYMAEVSRGWDEPNARDMGRMTHEGEIAAMERRLEKLEMTNMQPVQAISQTPLPPMPCAICLSYEHLVDECPTIPTERKCLVIATPTIPIGGTIQISLETTATSRSNCSSTTKKPQTLNKL